MRANPPRDLPEDFSQPSRRTRDEEDDEPVRSPRAMRLRLRGRILRTRAGRVAVAAAFLFFLAAIGFGLWRVRLAILHDPRFTIPSSQAIEISGNDHLNRAQLLSVFGGDVDRNLLIVPLDQRRAELESLPWVEHATVMRLLPNQLRVQIQERTPIAYVRQGTEIGLVDANGILLEYQPPIPDPGAPPVKPYSFPVVTGIAATDPLSTRAARMKLFLRFTHDLDVNAKSQQDRISNHISEVDLTDPEDVKALIPDSGTDILVHFGDQDFLTRYRHYIQNLPDWKVRYPKLASADMRYDREVVLEMAPGTAVPDTQATPTTPDPAAAATSPSPKPVPKPAKAKLKPASKAKPGSKPAPKSAAASKLHPKGTPR
jgi:cell division protein FtsQ